MAGNVIGDEELINGDFYGLEYMNGSCESFDFDF